MFRNTENDGTRLVRKSQHQYLGQEFADLSGRKIHHRRYLTAQKILRRIVNGELGAGSLVPNDAPKINREFQSRFSRFRKRLDLDNGSDANVDRQELIYGYHR
jgi:hypothetical protein